MFFGVKTYNYFPQKHTGAAALAKTPWKIDQNDQRRDGRGVLGQPLPS